MADDTDQLVISISADTSQINRAINRLLGTVNSSTKGIETAFTRTGAAMDGVGVSATKLQQQINALTGAGTSMKGRADDVAAYGASLDSLRAKYNPIFSLSKQYETELEGINNAAKVGAISSAEQAAAIDDLNDQYTTAQSATGKLASSHAGLSAQAMAAQHSVRSLIEQLALGIPPSQALTGQLNHLTFAASGEGGLTQAFKDAAAPLSGLLSAGVVTFAGIAASIGVATLAANSYLSAQQKVQASVLGAGRASGATPESINSVAAQGSTFGLSVSEAGGLASSLAATGKVANDNILPIVKMGHDIATAFGTDAKGASELLAKAFSDPVSGADQLNQRLGFLDAATKQNIANLMAQNNVFGAQKVLIDATNSSLSDFNLAESNSAKGWTAIENAASNAWGAVGKFFATSLGLGQSLTERLDAAKKTLDDLKSSGGQIPDINTGGMVDAGGSAAIQAQQKVVDDLTAAMQRNAVASINAQSAQRSFSQQSTVRDLTPEIAQQESLNNQLKVLTSLFDQLSNSEAAGETLKQLGLTFGQIADAIKKASSEVDNFKSSYQQALDSQKVQLQSITAFSPSSKGDVAFQQTLNEQLAQGAEYTKAATLAEGSRAIALKQVNTELSEQARSQLLSSNQSVASAQLESTLVGKSVGEQATLTANLAAQQQLEQIASQNRTKFNQAQYDQLTKINAALGLQKQAAAEASAQDGADFSVQTAFFTDIDQQIAAVQKQLHGNAWPQYMNDGLAATMRIADGMKQLGDLGKQATEGFFTDFETGLRNGETAWQSFEAAGVNALGKIADKLASMAADQLWASAFGGTGSGGILGLLGFGGATGAVNANGSIAGAVGPTSVGGAPLVFADGGYTGTGGKYQPAGIVHKGEFVFDQSAVNRIGVGNLMKLQKGYAAGGPVGLPTLPSMQSASNSSGGVTVHGGSVVIQGDASEKTVALIKAAMAQQNAELPGRVVQAVTLAKKRRQLA